MAQLAAGALGTDTSAVLMFRAGRLAGLPPGRQLEAGLVLAHTTLNPGFDGLRLWVD